MIAPVSEVEDPAQDSQKAGFFPQDLGKAWFPGHGGIGLVRDVGVEPEFPKRPVRDIHPGSSASFPVAVDVIHVFAWKVGDPSFGFLGDLGVVVEVHYVHGAGLDASRLHSGLHAARAKVALLHPGIRGVPFVLGDLERTGQHAVAAADAEPLVVDHRPLRRLLQGPHWAGRGTSRILAMQALVLDEFPAGLVPGFLFKELDKGVAVRAQLLRTGVGPVRGFISGVQVMPGLASDLAGPAAYASGCIHENAFGHGGFPPWLELFHVDHEDLGLRDQGVGAAGG